MALDSTTTGYLAVLVAALGFGSNFIPVKKCHTGNGLAFQFFFCWAILVAGLLVGIYRGFPSVPPVAMLGGVFWTTGNLLSVPAIKLVGLGLALLLWGISNMMMGWASGTFGLFGLDPQPPTNAALNYAGVAVALASLLVYLFVKPEDHASPPPSSSFRPTPRPHSHVVGSSFLPPKDGHGGLQTSLLMEEGGAAAYHDLPGDGGIAQDRHGADVFLPSLTGIRRFLLGVALALVAGVFFGTSFNAAYYVMDHAKTPGSTYAAYADLELMDFLFPHTCGIFLTSSAYFLLYLAASRLCCGPAPPQVYPAAILPAFLSGAIWSVAMVAWFAANANLSMPITFPIITATPGLVASLYGVLFFREIRGKRNLLTLAAAFSLTLTACLLIGFSM